MKKIKFLSVLGTLLLIFLFPASALPSGLPAFADSSFFASLSDMTAEEFDSDKRLFAAPGAESFEIVSFSDISPFAPVSGSGMACIRKTLAPGEWCWIEKSWDEEIGLSGFNSVFCLFSIASDDEISVSQIPVRLTLIDQKVEKELDILTYPGEADTLVFSLNGVDLSESISGFRLMWQNPSETESFPATVLIDALCFSYLSSNDLSGLMQFGSFEYSSSDFASVRRDATGLDLTFSEEGSWVALSDLIFKSGRMEFLFAEGTDFTSLKIEYAASRRVGEFLPADSLITASSLIFVLPAENGGEIRLVSSSSEPLHLTLLSLTPLSASVSGKPIGEITECQINSDRTEIVIRGTVADNAFGDLASCTLSLYDLSMQEDEDNYPILLKTPTATCEASAEFSFRISSAGTDGKTREYSKFLVSISDGRNMDVLGSAKYVGFPQQDTERSFAVTPKGFSGLSAFEAEEAGSFHASVEIETEKLITLGASRYEISVDGENVYFSEKYVEELDKKISAYEKSDIRLIACLTLKPSGDTRLDAILIHPSCDGRGENCAFNTAEKEGLLYFRAICAFLVERYGGNEGGRISSFSVGKQCDRYYSRYNMGLTSLSDAVSAYASALRILSQTCESCGFSGAVYASVSGRFFDRVRFGDQKEADALSFLLALCDEIEKGGGFSWGISCDPFESCLVGGEGGVFTDYSSLTEYLSLLSRKIVIDEHVFLPIADGNETADYVRAYAAFGKTGNLEAYITDRVKIDPEVLRMIDTQKAGETVLGFLGEEESDLATAFSAFPSRLFFENAFQSELTPTVGSVAISDFSESLSGWEGRKNIVSLENGRTMLDREGLLVFDLSGEGGIMRTYFPPADFSSCRFLTLEFRIVSLPEGLDCVKVKLTILSGRDECVYFGEAALGSWRDIVCDLSCVGEGFSLSEVRKIILSVSSPDETEIGEPLAVIGDVRLLSEILTDEELSNRFYSLEPSEEKTFFSKNNKPLVIGLCSATLISLTTLIVRAVRRREEDAD